MTVILLVVLLVTVATFCVALAFVLPRVEGLVARRRRGRQRLIQGGNVEIRAAGPQLRRVEHRGFFAELLDRLRGDSDGGFGPEGTGGGLTSGRVLMALMAMLATGFLLHMMTGLPLLVTLPVALVVMAFVMIAVLRMRVSRRRAAIADGMPEALETVVRTLRVGLPVSTALRHAGEKLQGPLAEELRATTERISFGQDTTEALYALANRTKNTDLHFLAASVSIQLVTGGNLADVLERLSGIARARQQLRRKVDSITAEARWSGRFLSVFPVLAILAVSMVSPGFFDPLLASDALVPVAVVVLFLLLLNVMFMRWLSKLE